MKSDTGNKMSDQLHLKANQRTVLLVFNVAFISEVQSQPSHEPTGSVLLTYASLKKAGYYRLPGIRLVRFTPLSYSHIAPPNGNQRRLLNLTVGKGCQARRKRKKLFSVGYF